MENKNNEQKEKSVKITKKIIEFIKSHKRIFEKLGFFTIAIIVYCLLCNPTLEQLLTHFIGETVTEALPVASLCMLIGGD